MRIQYFICRFEKVFRINVIKNDCYYEGNGKIVFETGKHSRKNTLYDLYRDVEKKRFYACSKT